MKFIEKVNDIVRIELVVTVIIGLLSKVYWYNAVLDRCTIICTVIWLVTLFSKEIIKDSVLSKEDWVEV